MKRYIVTFKEFGNSKTPAQVAIMAKSLSNAKMMFVARGHGSLKHIIDVEEV